MNPIIGTLILCLAIRELYRVMREYAGEFRSYRSRLKRVRRLRRTIQTDTFLRDTASNDVTREYYAEQVRKLTETLQECE